MGGWDARVVEGSPWEEVTVVGWDVGEVEGSIREFHKVTRREYWTFTLHSNA